MQLSFAMISSDFWEPSENKKYGHTAPMSSVIPTAFLCEMKLHRAFFRASTPDKFKAPVQIKKNHNSNT